MRFLKSYLSSVRYLAIPVQFYLRLTGFSCCLLSVIEFGLGGSITRYLSNVNNGAWWSTISIFLAGACAIVGLNRIWVRLSCVLSFFGVVTGLVGSIFEGLAAQTFHSYVSCGSIPSESNEELQFNYHDDDAASFRAKLISFGNSNGATDISYCMASYKMLDQFEYDTCYCVSSGGGFCGVYTLSKSSLSLKQNCGSIMSTYSKTLSASVSFCTITTFAVFFLFIFNSYLLYSKKLLVVDPSNLKTLDVDLSSWGSSEFEIVIAYKKDDYHDNSTNKESHNKT